ncbi:SMP-30/gluconolactonase/LRE family protein [Hymenobacter sp. BT186]|uniref:SMP-30/gluconolactonase/LRE family protein n=1 Tax=Hymenobacter telluris TaxID=2816474 RepID=A0A939F4C2_9BACT|nr:SMP-30/gluconolactonase/LRE family protein [Hymenobacter telluris]MBW3377176.1 SMP-30/gluconolactonase/LRE family protein [Hymenobacter norwichensis]
MPAVKYFIYLFLLALTSLPAAAQPSQTPLEEVAEFGRHQPIGVAVSQQGRIFVTFPKRPTDYDFGLAELVNGKRVPYPNAEWNQWDSTRAAARFVNVQALFVDQTNALWVLDPANPADEAPVLTGIKLLKINLATNQVERIYRFEDLPRERSGLNDVRVDTRSQVAYLSDPKLAGLVVLDLRSGKSRIVLQGHKSTAAAPGFVLRIDGKEVKDKNGKPFSSNVNGIALTHDFRYLYYRAINQTKLYRIPTDALRNAALTPTEVAARVEEVGETGISHGMIADAAGNVYLTDSPNHAVRRVTPAGRLETVVKDNRLLWPDSFGLGPDGYLYLTAAQIERTPKWNNGQDRVQYPFRLYRVKIK